jgi:hypothetical protein
VELNGDTARQALGDTMVPQDLFASVERAVKRRRVARKSAVVLFSMLVLTGAAWMRSYNAPAGTTVSGPATDATDDELQRLRSFVNAETIDEELQTYVVFSFSE